MENPLAGKRLDLEMGCGLSVKEMLDQAGFDWVHRGEGNTVVTIESDNTSELVEDFSIVPAPGETVGVVCIPTGGGGGGKNPLTTVLTIVVVAVATYFGGPAAGLRAGLLFSAAANFVAGNQPKVDQSEVDESARGSLTYSIQGSRNRANRYGPIPAMIGGTARIYPPFAAEPYTEAAGEFQYLRQRFAIAGPNTIDESSLRIGETLLSSYEDAEYEIANATQESELPTLYADGEDIKESPVGVVLENPNEFGVKYVTVESETPADEMRFNLDSTEFYYDDPVLGQTQSTVKLYVEYRWYREVIIEYNCGDQKTCTRRYTESSKLSKLGDDGWIPVPAINGSTSGVTDGVDGNFEIFGNTLSPISFGLTANGLATPDHTFQFPYSYDFRITRYTIDSTDNADHHDDVELDDINYYLSSVFQESTQVDENIDYAYASLSWVERTTETATKEVTFDYSVPRLFEILADGSYANSSVQTITQIKETGTSEWVPVDAEWCDELGRIDIAGKYYENRNFSYRYNVTEGQYDQRWARITPSPEPEENVFNDVTLSVIRSIAKHPGINFSDLPPLTVIDLRVKATNQLNGVIDSFSFNATAQLPVWNGSSVVYQESSNPAWAFFNVLYGYSNKNRIIDTDRYDFDSLLEWATLCDEQGWNVNGILDTSSTVSQTLRSIAAVGRASLSMVGNKYGVAVDWEKDTITQVFTPRNSWNFQGIKVWEDEVHAVRARFADEDNGFQWSERIVYADGYNEDGSGGLIAATKFSEQEVQYITNSDQVWKFFRYVLANRTLRPEIYKFNADIENLRCVRGDRIRIVHDVMLVGLGQARIKSVTTDGGGNVTQATIDSLWSLDSAETYAINIQRFNGDVYEGFIFSPGTSQEVDTISFNPAIPSSVAPGGGELIAFGTADEGVGLDLIIHEIAPGSNLTATITCQDYAPDIQTAADGTIPPYDPSIVYGTNFEQEQPEKPIIETLITDETVLLRRQDGSLVTRAILSFSQPKSKILVGGHEAQYKLSASSEWTVLNSTSANTNAFIFSELDDGDSYDFRIRSVSQYGVASDWEAVYDETVIGKTTPPPAVDTVFYNDGVISWEYTNKPADHRGYVVRYLNNTELVWENGQPAHDDFILDNSFDVSRFSGQISFMVKALDTVNLESNDFKSVIVNFGDATAKNVVETIDYHPEFDGFQRNCSVDGGLLLADELTAYFPEDDLAYSPSTADAYLASFSEMAYINSYPPDVGYVGYSIILDTTIVGESVIEYRILSPNDNEAYSPTTDAAYSPSETPAYADNSPWMPWPGSVIIESDATYQFRTTIEGGALQGEISEWSVVVDAPDIVETANDVVIASGTGTRLTLQNTYTAINYVNIRALQGTSSGISVVVDDKNPTLGPLVRVLNGSGTSVGGTIDYEIGGY